jgi:hypothetical protein
VIYLKSILVGMAAVFLFLIISLVVWSILVSRGDQEVGIDVISVGKQWRPQLIVALVFAAGFYWEFKRVSK